MFIHVTHMEFGTMIREIREAKLSEDPSYSIRQLSKRLGVNQTYLSQIERNKVVPSEDVVLALAKGLDQNPHILLAAAGKVSSELQEIIRKRPQLFAELLEQLENTPDHAILKVVREIRDGDW